MEIVETVKNAMLASERLTGGSYFILEDGTVLTAEKSYKNFAGEYAALPGLKKIADSSSEMELLALTETGDLYYHQTKILAGVKDVVYSSPCVIWPRS